MNTKIRELDALTINQIAAGEVVERPLSVVKELVENAIDAGGKAITVEIKAGGIKLIRVTDNGGGISKDQVTSAFQRHFTSKIEKIDDLFAISSLGFRGEALSSIAGVSRSEMITKPQEALVGSHLAQEGMTQVVFEEVGAPNGTTVIVKDLFFNTPARRKFLKSEKTETSYIVEFMQRISLAYRQIAFKLIVDGKVRLQTNGDGDLRAAILYIFGSETAKRLKEVDYGEKGVHIQGYIGTPELNRGNRNYEIYFVNGRYVKSKWIQEGIEEGSFGYVMNHQFPFAVLEIRLEPDKLDVNVHPQKAEVRFENGYLVKEIVSRAIKAAITEKETIPAVSFEQVRKAGLQPDQHIKQNYNKAEPFEVNRKESQESGHHLPKPSQTDQVGWRTNGLAKSIGEDGADFQLRSGQEVDFRQDNHSFSSPPPSQGNFATKGVESLDLREQDQEVISGAETYGGNQSQYQAQAFIEEKSLKSHRVIGQVFDTYWLIEFQGALYVIDQHAAHEKVLYERFVRQVNDSQIHSQHLLDPLVIELNAREMENYIQAQGFFAKLGFEVEAFGETSLKVSGVPYLLNQAMQKEDFIYFLDQLDYKHLSKNAQTIDHELATMACKAAVKGNNRLSQIEYERLIEELLSLENPYHCPHGRPTLIKMTRYDLDRKFKRIL